MSTAILEHKPTTQPASKTKLYEELKIKADLSIDGVDIDPTAAEVLKHVSHQEQVHSGFEMDLETHVGREHPSGFHLPLGLKTAFKWSRKSRYHIAHENGRFILTTRGTSCSPSSSSSSRSITN